MSFPYTQCISAITIPAGDYQNTTFVVAAYQSGLSVGQLSPNPNPPNYSLGGVSNLDIVISNKNETLGNTISTNNFIKGCPHRSIHSGSL